MTQTALSSPPEQHWRRALADGRLLLQRDPASGQHHFPPRLVSPAGSALEWVEAAGTGTVYSVTIIRPRPPARPYNVVLVTLSEGPRLMSKVTGIAAEDVTIGMAVTAQIEDRDGQGVLVFHPA